MTIFLLNKYSKIYNAIIDRGIERAWTRKTAPCYVERHHIVPKCKSFDGSNDSINLVFLTAKEHYICHYLLPKMCENRQKSDMLFAFHKLIYSKNRLYHKITSRVYEKSKAVIAELSRYREFTPTIKANMSASAKQRWILLPMTSDAKSYLSSLYKGKTYNERFGLEESLKLKKQRSESKTGSKNPMFGRAPWNKGETKLNNPKIQAYGLKQKETKEKKENLI